MGQSDTLMLLESLRNGWVTAKDISKILEISEGSVNRSLQNLKKGNLIETKKRKRYNMAAVAVWRTKKCLPKDGSNQYQKTE